MGRSEIKYNEIDEFLVEINNRMGQLKTQECHERCKSEMEKLYSNARNIYEAYKLES
jgi:hypothetical protein